MRQHGIRYGLILGLISIVISLGSNLLGLSDPTNASPGTGIIIGIGAFAITFILIFMAIKSFRDDVNGGILSLGSAIKLGILVALVAALISGVFNLIYYTLIEPDYFEGIISAMEEKFEEQGMDKDQIDQAMRLSSMFTSPVMTFIIGIIWSAFIGLIISLISGLILKRESTQMPT